MYITEDSNVEELKVAPKQQQPTALESLLAPSNVSTEKQEISVGALETLLAPVVAAGAVGNIPTQIDGVLSDQSASDDESAHILSRSATPPAEILAGGGSGESFGVVPAGSLGATSLKPEFELPIRATTEFLSSRDPMLPAVMAKISAWPVRKSGFLFRKDLQPLRFPPNSSNYSSLFPNVRPTASTLSALSNSSNSSGKKYNIMSLLQRSSKSNIHIVNPDGGNSTNSVGAPGSSPAAGGIILDGRSPSITSTLSYPGNGLDDDDDWSLYYVEVRERYMFFYLVTPTAPSPQPQQQINVLPIVPENREETSVRRNSVTGGSSVFDSNRPRSQISFTSLKATAVGKPMGFNKIFDSLKRIKPGANVYSRPSSSDLRLRGKNPSPIPPAISQPSNIGQNVYQPPNSLGDRRSSADSSRSVWGNFTLNDIKSAPRVLVQYLPLHLSSLEYVFTRANGPIFQTFSDISPQPSSYPSFLSLSVRVGISSVLDTHPCGMEERIMLDIFEGLSWEWNNVAQPNQRPHGSIHTNDSITSVGSLSSRPSPELKKAELDEWVAAVRLASLLSFDPLVSTYETWEQTQMQAMRRVDTGASSVTAKASNASIGSLGTVRDSSGFMKRSLTKLSFGMAPDRTDIARSGAGRTSPLEGASSAASVKSNSAGNWWPGKRDSVIAVVNAGGDDGIYGSSPGADRSLSNKLSFPKILTAKPKREDSMSMMSVEPLKIEPVKINVSLTKRADSPNVNPTSPQQYTHSQQLQAHIRVGRGSNASNLYKPVDSSPLSPPQMATSKSSFSWRERGQSNPPIFTGSSVPPTQSTLSARVEHDAPLVDPGKLTLGRQRAASHSMLKSPAISTASPSPVAPVISESYRKWGLLGNKRSADVHDVTAKSATTAETNSKRTSGFAEIVVKKTPSRSFRFGGKPKGYESFMMRRTNTVASQSSSIRRVPTKQSNKDKKRYSAGTFVSMNGTVQTAIEWTDEVPLVLKKCIKLIEDIGLEVEGIYRLSGKVNVMNKLLGLFEEDATKVHLFPPPDVQVKASLASSPYIAESRRMSINSSTSSFDSAFPSFPTGSLSKVIAMGSSSANPERHRQGTGSGTAILLGRNSPVVTKPPKVEPQRGRLSKRDVLPASMSSSNLYDNDVHVVAGVVKAYLRKGLPPSAEPVTTVALHNAFVVAAKTADWRNRMIAIQDTVHQLPRENFQILKFICQHLKKVSTFSEINKMTVQNLSTIFAPNLFVSSLTDMQAHAMAVEIMIEYSDWVFSDPEYEKDETADRASDQASIMSEDEIYSDFKKSSGDIFDPNKYLRKQYGDLEKDSVGEVLDLIPHEDSSSQIPGDSVRGDEVSGHVFDGERRSNLGELEDDEVESYEEAFVVNGSGKGELSVTPQTNESVSVSGLGECGNRASSDVSVLQRFDGSNASFGWNADDSVPKSYDDKRLRRKMVVSTVLDSVNKLALSSPTLMVEVPDNLLPRERSIGGEEGFGGTSSHFGSSPESPTSMFGSSSRRSSMSRSRRLGSSSASGKQE
ncbi:Rho GTPase-activating protein 21 [Entophlyctis luteolus]|nr:Rho GTPase-activating protein 21 [Entophlyctis luteolus]